MFIKSEDMKEKKIHLKIEINFRAKTVHCDIFLAPVFGLFVMEFSICFN